MSRVNELEEKLNHWDKQLSAYIEKIKEEISNNTESKAVEQVHGYFTSSINVRSEEEGDNCVIGSFYVKNLSPKTLKQLSICLIMKADISYKFSGKYATTSMINQKKSVPFQWEQVEVPEEKEGVYWFRLSNEEGLGSFSKVSFPDFMITWDNQMPCSLNINGFVYSEENPDGIPADNSIHLAIQ